MHALGRMSVATCQSSEFFFKLLCPCAGFTFSRICPLFKPLDSVSWCDSQRWFPNVGDCVAPVCEVCGMRNWSCALSVFSGTQPKCKGQGGLGGAIWGQSVFQTQLQASSTNSTRLLSIGVPSHNRVLRRQHLDQSMSPQEHALIKSLICALRFDTSEHPLMGPQWCLVTTNW